MKALKFLRHNQIDKEKWNLCVHNSLNRKIYAFSWYLDIVAEKWNALIYGDYDLVFPIVFKHRFFFKKIYHPFFCQQLGPFTSLKTILDDQELGLSILNFLNQKYHNFELSINDVYTPGFKNLIIDYNLNLNYLDRINLELNLNSSYKELYSHYSNNHKRSLKKTINLSCSLKIRRFNKMSNVEIDYLTDLYKEKVGSKANLNAKNYQAIRSLIKTCGLHDLGFFVGLRNSSKELLAGAFFLSCFNRDILIFNFSDLSLNFNSMLILIDRYIKLNAKKNKILDFEGSMIPGVKRFYSGFGSTEKNYIHIIK